MIRIKKGNLIPEKASPEEKESYQKLMSSIEKETKLLWLRYQEHPEDFQGSNKGKGLFKDNIYRHEKLKQRLMETHHHKCCFCEDIITREGGDVEHFRPKSAYKQEEGTALRYPGYFWLVYDWENLLWCCKICNQQCKRNLFPLSNPQNRATPEKNNIKGEEPLIIDPTKKDPENYITFGIQIGSRQKRYGWEVARSVDNNPYGEATINIFKLNDRELQKKRRGYLKHTQSILDNLDTLILFQKNVEVMKN